MDLIEKLFIFWVVVCVLILCLSIFNLAMTLRNRRDIKQLQNS
jgi:hypothetical protein